MTSLQKYQTPLARSATTDDGRTVAATLASAFSDDPLVLWFLGRRPYPESRLVPGFGAIARNGLRRSDPLVFVAEDGASAAIWRGIDGWKLSAGELLRTLPANARSFGLRTVRVLQVLAAVEKVHPDTPHYYLEILGTRADRQGKGLGGTVIAPMLERCDEEGVPAYLESSNPRNQPFYARHGFVAQREISLPGGCPPVVPMWRDPR